MYTYYYIPVYIHIKFYIDKVWIVNSLVQDPREIVQGKNKMEY